MKAYSLVITHKTNLIRNSYLRCLFSDYTCEHCLMATNALEILIIIVGFGVVGVWVFFCLGMFFYFVFFWGGLWVGLFACLF